MDVNEELKFCVLKKSGGGVSDWGGGFRVTVNEDLIFFCLKMPKKSSGGGRSGSGEGMDKWGGGVEPGMRGGGGQGGCGRRSEVFL